LPLETTGSFDGVLTGSNDWPVWSQTIYDVEFIAQGALFDFNSAGMTKKSFLDFI